MSYILDALRRADAERQRGQAPGLQQVTHEAPRPAPAAGTGWMGWAVALLAFLALLAAGGAAVWWWLQPGPTAPPPPGMPIAAAPAPASSVIPVTPVTPVMPTVPPAASSPPSRPPRVAVPPPPPPAPKVTVKAPPPKPSAPASAAPAPRPVLASALPEPLRGAVQRLQVGGVVHSQERSQSFVMVGGQIAHEGDTLAPGIVLERIGPRSLLLRVADQAVELPL